MKTSTAIIVGALCIVALPVGCGAYSVWSSVTTAPARVINKTLGTDNIITNYEYYFDTKASYDARVSQLTEQAKYLASETDPGERSRLRIELSAMQQSCRELASQYNANAAKINRGLFQDRHLPPTLEPMNCEISQ